jgi:two-component system cell cycle sensor histidine kinase/response regulator CckA
VDGNEQGFNRESIDQQLRFLTAVVDQGSAGIVASDTERRIRVWSRGAEELLGIRSGDAVGRMLTDFEKALLSGSESIRDDMKEELAAGRVWEGEIELRHRSGRPFTALVRNGPLFGEGGEIIGYAGMIVDVTEHKRSEEELQRRAGREEALAEFGRRALAEPDISALLDRAVRVVADVLEVDLAKVLELREDGRVFEVKAGVGLEPGAVGTATVPADDSHAALTLTEETVIVPDYDQETRFVPADLLRRHRARSGVTAVIQGNERAYGVIGAHSRELRTFTAEDAHFLQAVGNVLAGALTRRRAQRLEHQLQQAQRLEAVGRLAGGVAHDFNNLLSVILNYAQFLIGETTNEQTLADLREIEGAAKRAADLTRQLLVFSRRDLAESIRVDLTAVARDTESLLRRTIGEHVELATRLPPDTTLPVELGPGQADQILINLVVNARDAMADGGTIVIETSEVEIGNGYQPVGSVPPGRYAMLCVSDDGAGMSADVAAQAFDPFFTTKPQGEGTGLGLATVYGIVNQAGGQIRIESEEGRGTTIRIYLPLAEQGVEENSAPAPGQPAEGGGQCILVVEDEAAVRRMMCRTLEQCGYDVVGAADGDEALRIFEEGGVDLVLTDVVMPGMSGKELLESLRERRPDLKAIYMSGYTGDIVSRHRPEDDEIPLLQKPFSSDQLLEEIQRALS